MISRWAETRCAWHLAVDTGMSRAGVQWNQVRSLHDAMVQHPPEGVFTHFHSADLDDSSRDEQERRFGHVVASRPFRPPLIHAENGAAVEWCAGSRWSLARPGIHIYGVASRPGAPLVPEPVVSMRARVVDLRQIDAGESVSYGASWRAGAKSRIATLPIGYADGYRRSLGNRGRALVRGKIAKVVGWVTMDMTMIDVTGIDCELGDIVTLIGSDGEATIGVQDVSEWSGLSPYEILTGLRGRLPRRYTGMR
jgi:alanine racemase